MDFNSFLTSLGTSFVLFLVLMFLFTWLSRRPGNHVLYYPNRILRGMDPYEGLRASRNPFAWIREALVSTEADVIRMSGVDSAVYFVFLTTVLGILVLSGLVLLPVLLPVAATARGVMKANDTTSEGSFNDLDKLSMGHVEQRSARLWAFVIATYWVSFVTYCLLWKAYKHVSDLRAAALMSPDVKNEQFAVVNKIYEELEGYRKKLTRAEAIYAESKAAGNPEGTRPTTKTGFLGLIGKKVDAIEYYDEKIKELIPKLVAEQRVTLKDRQQSAAIIFFNNRVTAAAASQSLHDTMVDTWTVSDAPEPHQLLWTNLLKNFYTRRIRQYVIYFIVFFDHFLLHDTNWFHFCIDYSDNLKKLLPFLKPVVDQATIKTVLEAYLPQLALIIFLALLPKFLLFLSKAEGIASESHAQRAASGNGKPPGSATFFLTFVALKFFVGYGLELSRIVPLIIFHLKKKYLCKTEAEVKEAWAPGDLGYATRIPGDMLILTIVICYSVIAPLIIPFGIIYYGLGWIVLRNQVLKVYVPSYESYGRIWPHIYLRIMASLILYQATMLGYFSAKEFIYTPVLIPLIVLSFIFVLVCRNKFYRFFQCTALEVASRELKETPNMQVVFRSFIPQA
ncbi:UNVERIFIED_CONTAM: CSC1-like protein ERD4 [Sesamum radiatum]|uniref:CSC1-like protein ERD4 n=1 Tax=Sesamum radiatum TaxID=300843 RepID=A0AAW2KHP6_SESRA